MTQSVSLTDVATIFPGTSVPGKIAHQEHGTHYLVLPRHVDDDGRAIFYDDLPTSTQTRMSLSVPEDRLLKVGDIVFMSRGEKNRAAVIATLPQNAKITAPSVFLVLRPLAAVMPSFLAWALNQRPLQDAIRQIRTASVSTPMVPRDALAALTLPLPSLEQQARIAALADLMLDEQRLQRRLTEAIAIRNRVIGARLLNQTI